MITKTEILRDLKYMGIVHGDVIFMHSALSSIGRVDGGADALIDALCEAVGSEGTIAMSTLSFGEPFDADTTPSGVGAASETLRRRAGSVRSKTPVHSIVAMGKRAVELCENHDKFLNACGEGTPYTRLRDMNAKILLLGVDMNRNTTLHSIEDIMELSYLKQRVVARPTYLPDDGRKTITLEKFPPGHRDFLRMTPYLRRRDALYEGKIGNAVVKVIDVARMFSIGETLVSVDPFFFLCENEKCAFCSPERKEVR